MAGVASTATANPLMGHWQLDLEASSSAASAAGISGGREIEFTANAVIAGGAVQKVEYELESDRVLVTYPAQGRGQVVRVLEPDVIRMDLPMDEFLVYRRCTQDNRLLGRWKVDTHASHTAAIVPFETVEVLEFRPGEMRMELTTGPDLGSVEVAYEVSCDLVAVKNVQLGEAHRYRILAADRAEGINELRPEWKLYFDRVK
jgi:hypothetical protein